MKSNRKPNNNVRGSKKSHKIKYNQPVRPVYLAPPHFNLQDNRTWVLRGVVSAGFVAQTITANLLAGFLGVIATGTTTSVFLCDQFRLKRICSWTPVVTAGTPVSSMMKYADDPASNTQSGAPRTQSDSSISFDRPAYCCLEPPKDNTSIFSQWSDSSLTTAWIVVSWPAGTVVDFYFNWILDDLGSTQAGPALIAATAGNIYHKSFTVGGGTLGVVTPLNGI